MDVIEILKKINLYEPVRKKYYSRMRKKRLSKRYTFENRIKNKEKVCFVLAGYKPFLYDIIFKRIKKFVPSDVEVCLLSSGKYCEDLSKIAKENDWSYLSTKRNCVSLIQNIAINIFKDAKYIYKLDEDIFITKNFFETLLKTLNECEKNGETRVGFVGPTIPINGFGNLNILKRFELVEYYTNKFEKPLYAAGRDRKVESDPEVAKFFWGFKNKLPNIDKMNEIMENDEFKYVTCPIKFSIGAILFKRNTWEEMNMFDVKAGACMGLDEEYLCNFCLSNSKPIIVSLNSVVGHLSFGTQNKTMEDYFNNNKNLFDINVN